MTAASLTQKTFRGRDDDVALNSTTFTYAQNTGWSQAPNQNFRVRFVVQETANRSTNVTFRVHYSLNGGAYAAVGSTTPVQPTNSAQYADGDPTTRLLDGTGTFAAGVGDASDGLMPSAGNIAMAALGNTEVEACLLIAGAQVNDGDTVALRLYLSNGSALQLYSATPTLTVVEAAETVVSPDGAGHAQAATEPAFVQDHVFGPEAGSHAHAASGPTVAQEYVLQPAGSTHAQKAASPSVAGAGFTAADVGFRLSGGAANTDPAASLGGAISAAEIVAGAEGNLFDAVAGAESAAGDVEYRCLYVRNGHATTTWSGVRVWLGQETTSADTALALGLDPAGVGGTATTVADEGTAPAGVTFTQPLVFGDALVIGDIGPGQHQAVWVRRTVSPDAAASALDEATLRFSSVAA